MFQTSALVSLGRISLAVTKEISKTALIQEQSVSVRHMTSFKNKFFWKPFRYKANAKPKFPVILLEDDEKLGRKGEVVKVERGFARHMLIPENRADYATEENLEKYNITESSLMPRASLKFINKIEKIHLKMGRPRDEPWEISKHNIALALRKVHKLHVPVHCMGTDFESIKEFGDYQVDVTVNSEATVSINVTVEEWEPKLRPEWEEILAGESGDAEHNEKHPEQMQASG